MVSENNNINISAGTGPWVQAADNVDGIKFIKIKLDVGAAGISNPLVGALDVVIQDVHSETVDLYLYRLDAELTLTAPVAVDDEILSVESNANVTNGDSITFYEGAYSFQSLVVSSTTNSITIATPCDKVFSVSTVVHVGPWNMAVNGSSTPQVFSIHAPTEADFDITVITISALSGLSMDATTFLGIVDGITKGFLLRYKNTNSKNIGLFVNNLGFEELGYEVTYYPVNKKSEYGMIAKSNFRNNSGVVLRLNGQAKDEIQATIRDDLSSESLMAIIVKGHVVTD